MVLGPGGMGFYTLLGALTTIDLSMVEEISGASAGALLGLFVAMDWSVDDIVSVVMTINPQEELCGNLWNVFSHWGIFEHNATKKILYKIFSKKIYFKDLKKKLWISSFNVSMCRTEYFSSDTHPDMCVFDAVCMSISVPVLFQPVLMNGFYYIDGAIDEWLPMHPFMLKSNDDVVAINVDLTRCDLLEPKSFFDFLSKIMKTFLRSKKVTGMKCKFINIPVEENVFNFNLPIEVKNKLFLMGVKGSETISNN